MQPVRVDLLISRSTFCLAGKRGLPDADRLHRDHDRQLSDGLYLTAWPSRDLVRAAHQQITREWWETRRGDFSLYVSQLVLDEAAAGDAKAAAERLDKLAGIPLLDYCDPTLALASTLERALQLTAQARGDALHVAVCAANGIEYLLTWNCRHLANAALAPRIEQACRAHGVAAPRIVTPAQLLELP